MRKILEYILKISISCLIFGFTVVLVIVFYILLNSNTHNIYKANWNIDIPNPYKIKYITSNEGYVNFEILNYKTKDIQKLVEKNFFQKIDNNNVVALYNNYYELIETLYTKFLNKEEKEVLYEKDLKSLFNENNYYVLIEKNERYSNNYKFLFLLLDFNQNIIYSLSYYAYIR